MAPASVSVPAPALVSPKPDPPMTPPSDNVLAATVSVRLAPSVIAPVVCVRLAEPVKVRSAPNVTALVTVAATEASKTPPFRTRAPAPVPNAFVAEPATRVPAAPSVVAPV